MADEKRDEETGLKLDKWQGLLIFLIAQTISGFWWAANVSASLQVLKEQSVETKATVQAVAANRYTAADAIRDLTIRDDKIKENKERISEIDRRMVEFERRFNLKVQ